MRTLKEKNVYSLVFLHNILIPYNRNRPCAGNDNRRIIRKRVSFELQGFETTLKRYDLTTGEEFESTVELVDANYDGFIVCTGGGKIRTIHLIILDASSKQPVPFAFVSPYKRCSKHGGHVLLSCQPAKQFSIILDIKANGYSRWRHRVYFPPDKTEFNISLKRK